MQFAVHRFKENELDVIQLRDQVSGAFANILPFCGGLLNGFGVHDNGSELQVIEGFDSLSDWQANKERGFKSAKLSPFVCRIHQSRYNWNGKDYVLDKYTLSGSAIHGLIYDAPFSVVEQSANNQYAETELRYVFPGNDGYPFSYECYIRYRIEKDNTLGIVTAIHNRSNENMPVADGWHPYFQFNRKVDELLLKVCSDTKLEYDGQLIPTGKTISDRRWLYGAEIGNIPLDNGYVLDFTQHQPLCTIKDPQSGVSVEFLPDSSYPYLQLYIPVHRNSIAIENLSAAPDSFNNKIGLTILAPGHTRTFKLKYRIRIDQ
jgi:aldose 1-epimerase